MLLAGNDTEVQCVVTETLSAAFSYIPISSSGRNSAE